MKVKIVFYSNYYRITQSDFGFSVCNPVGDILKTFDTYQKAFDYIEEKGEL